GPPHEAKIFFGKEDFAEIYTELEPTSNDSGKAERAEQRFKKGDQGKSPEDYLKYVEAPLQARSSSSGTQQQKGSKKREKRGNPWLQFLLLTQRYLELLRNDTVN